MPTAKITYVKVNGLASYTKVNGLASYLAPRSLVTYTDLRLESFLDADTKNRYFRLDGFAFDDSASVTANKSLQDSILGFTDSAYAAVTKNVADTLGFSDVANLTLIVRREFIDAFLLGDSTSISVGRRETDALTPTDAYSYVVSKNLSDTLAAIADAAYLATTKGVADTLSAADTFTRAVTFSRNFSDAFVLDDFTNVNALQKSTIASKTNTFGFSDNQAFATQKKLSDAASVADVFSAHFATSRIDFAALADEYSITTDFRRSQADSALVADSVNVQLRSLASSVLNTTAMNVATLNN